MFFILLYIISVRKLGKRKKLSIHNYKCEIFFLFTDRQRLYKRKHVAIHFEIYEHILYLIVYNYT